MKARFTGWLWAGDVVCLSLFILTGLQTHDSAAPLARFALNAAPLMAAWTLAAWALGALQLAQPPSYRHVLSRTLTAWLVAAPLALIVRALWLRSATIVLIFMLVTLGLGGASLLLWRGAAVWFLKRRAR